MGSCTECQDYVQRGYSGARHRRHFSSFGAAVPLGPAHASLGALSTSAPTRSPPHQRMHSQEQEISAQILASPALLSKESITVTLVPGPKAGWRDGGRENGLR